MKTLIDRYNQGKYREIVHQWELGKLQSGQPEFDLLIIGSLCQSGRVEDAEQFIAQLDYSTDRADFHFFLLIGWSRSLQIEKARKHLKWLVQQRSSDRKNFFIFQGIGFFRYYSGDYQGAISAALKSRQLTLMTDTPLWQKILAEDLVGHTYFHLGQESLSIEHLQRALTFAKKAKFLGYQSAIQIAISIYEARHSFQPTPTIKALEEQTTKIQDSYSINNLRLEIAHQYILAGRYDEADRTLNSIKRQIFSANLRRQKFQWHWEWAFLEFLKGRKDLSESHLSQAKSVLHPEFDFGLHTKLQGAAEHYLLEQPLGYSTQNVRWKQVLQNWKQSPSGGTKIIDLGLLFVFSQLASQRNQPLLIFGALPRGIVIHTVNHVHVVRAGCTELIQRALILLARGNCPKEVLVEDLWGYEYHPIRHEKLIHGLIGRCRKLLGPLENLIVSLEQNRFGFSEPVNYKILKPEELLAPRKQSPLTRSKRYNIRQLLLLEDLGSGFISPKDYSQRFHVTAMTTFRDLDHLRTMGHLERIGQGRAVVYRKA